MRATNKKQAKKNIAGQMNLFFFGMFFLSPEIASFFGNRQQSKKHMVFLVMAA